MTDVTQSFAATFVDELAAQGVEFACVSPGSRSAPIAMALQRHPRIKVLVQIDERCGSFFAVGLGKATGKPAVILSTSGTAAAEFHAAVVEASIGKGKLFLYGPEILFRSQPHGTYKLFFNGIYYGYAKPVNLN